MPDLFWICLGLLGLFAVVGGIARRPLALVFSLALRLGVGTLLLVVWNFVSAFLSYNLPINLASISISGILGVPGLFLLVYICHIMKTP